MSPAPPHSAIAHYLLENPWPVVLVCAILGIAIGLRGSREGQGTKVAIGAGLLALAVIVFGVAWFVTTAGERAVAVARTLVASAEAGDPAAGMMLIAPDATLHFERPESPGLPIESIARGLDSVATDHVIEDNSVTRLRGYTVDGDTGVAHLACWTTTGSSMGAVPSQWILRVKRQPDGSWKIARITCVSIAGRPAVREIVEHPVDAVEGQ